MHCVCCDVNPDTSNRGSVQIFKYREEYAEALRAFAEACRLDPKSEPSQEQQQQLEDALLGMHDAIHATVTCTWRRGSRAALAPTTQNQK